MATLIPGEWVWVAYFRPSVYLALYYTWLKLATIKVCTWLPKENFSWHVHRWQDTNVWIWKCRQFAQLLLASSCSILWGSNFLRPVQAVALWHRLRHNLLILRHANRMLHCATNTFPRILQDASMSRSINLYTLMGARAPSKYVDDKQARRWSLTLNCFQMEFNCHKGAQQAMMVGIPPVKVECCSLSQLQWSVGLIRVIETES